VSAETPQKIKIAGREIHGQLIFIHEDEIGKITEIETVR